MPVAVAAAEVHLAVDPGWIPLQHLLDEADALEELAPVERSDQPQAGNQVGDNRLFGRLVLPFRADGVLNRLPARGQRPLELTVQVRGDRPECPRALQQAGDERMMSLRRPRVIAVRRRFDCRGQTLGGDAVRPGLGDDVAALAEMIEQRQLQHARPRPQLPHRQRRHRLKGADETLQPLRIEPAGARPDQLQGEGIDARLSRELIRDDERQTLEEGAGEVVLNVPRGGGDDMKVVEEPFRGGRGRLAARFVGERLVDAAQRPHVGPELAKMRPAAPAASRLDREQGGQAAGVFLDQLDAEQFDPSTTRRSRLCLGVRH
jgi:hypothetical protein